MKARLRKLLADLGEAFWVIPFLLVLGGILAGVGLVRLDRSGLVPQWLIESAWLYSGGGTGARTMLGAIASSTIGVAGTVFSITIAALSLAAGQMGPRLLRNFVRDRANQVTLGVFLATFAYALMVLRSVRTQSEGAFVPHLSLTVGLLLAFLSVGTLVFFVAHIANRINVDTVIELVSDDVRDALRRLAVPEPGPTPPDAGTWQRAARVTDDRRGYFQQFHVDSLADWAAERNTVIHMLVRPGDYVFPGAAIAELSATEEGASDAIRDATALGPRRVGSLDLEFAVDQLVEVAVRALSPGINDPHTALSVLDRLGASLCELVSLHLPTGVTQRNGRPVLIVPAVDYDGLTDSMFHMIRQNAAGSATVLIRALEVLTVVVSCEHDPARRPALQRHARLLLGDAERDVKTPDDLDDVRRRHAAFLAACDDITGPARPSKKE